MTVLERMESLVANDCSANLLRPHGANELRCFKMLGIQFQHHFEILQGAVISAEPNKSQGSIIEAARRLGGKGDASAEGHRRVVEAAQAMTTDSLIKEGPKSVRLQNYRLIEVCERRCQIAGLE